MLTTTFIMPVEREVTMHDLFTHTAGFTYDFMKAHPVDALYDQRGVGEGDLAEMVQKLSKISLLFSPDTRWNYSFATDILGYVIKLLSGQSLDAYFAEHILEPLNMADTAFSVSSQDVSRFAACYEYHDKGFCLIDKPSKSSYLQKPVRLSGWWACFDSSGLLPLLSNDIEQRGIR